LFLSELGTNLAQILKTTYSTMPLFCYFFRDLICDSDTKQTVSEK